MTLEDNEIGFVLLKDDSELGYSIFKQNGYFYICEDTYEAKELIENLLNQQVEVFLDINLLLKKYPAMKCYKQIILSAPKGVQIVKFTVDWNHNEDGAAFTKQTAETILQINIANFVAHKAHNIYKSPEWDTISPIVILEAYNIPDNGFDIASFANLPANEEGFSVG